FVIRRPRRPRSTLCPYTTLFRSQARSHADIGAMLGKLSDADQKRVLEAMNTIEGLLGARPEGTAAYVLRPHQPGDGVHRLKHTRSEEHTSELQSRSDLVCRLLLE